ncbi:S8 family serine peptidase [uncultured Rothia sp.]|uniref:S8 family peptidase n=1 Tax=uncultured Rothia sp. TaxID=316088 RepID=UPI00321721A8
MNKRLSFFSFRALATVLVGLFLLAGFLPALPAEALPAPTLRSSTSALEASKGDSTRAREYWLTDYNFDKVWKESTGKGVTVAVIDTGVDASHQDLKNNVLKGWDASGNGNKNGWEGIGVEPEHGTLVASIIAGHGHEDGGSTGNSSWPGKPAGIVGVAPEAKILPISLEIGASETAIHKSIDEQIPQAVRYAVDHGADIINLSVGSNKTSWPQSWDSAFAYAEEKGVLVVAAAGNRGSGLTQVGAPATIPGVLTVGGVDSRRQDSWSSSSQGISIAVVAPSEELIGAIPANKYALWSGTSGSAPMVSALAALIKSQHPELTSAQIIQRIIDSADDAGEPGRDPIFGYGIINPEKTLSAHTTDDTEQNPLGSMLEWISVHRKHTLEPESQVSETPVHRAGEQLNDVAAPTPARPAEDSGILLFIVLGGFAFWVLIITAGTIYRLKNVGRSTRRPLK